MLLLLFDDVLLFEASDVLALLLLFDDALLFEASDEGAASCCVACPSLELFVFVDSVAGAFVVFSTLFDVAFCFTSSTPLPSLRV